MSKLYTGRMGVFAALALVLACGVDTNEFSKGEQGVVLAKATPDTDVTRSVTTRDIGTTSPAPKPKLTSVTYTEAETVFRKGQYHDARELFDAYVESKPSDMQGQYMLGLSAWKSGDHGQAEIALRRAVELNGESVKARTNLARVLLEQGRAIDALPHVQKAVELKPESHEVWRVLGNVQAEIGDSEAALESYRTAIMRNDRDAWSMNNYGLLLIQLGSYDDALPPLARAVELMPGSAIFHKNLGVALERVRARGTLGADGQVDLTAQAQWFVEEIERWRSADRHIAP